MAKRPGHNMGNLSIIPVKNNQMVERNPNVNFWHNNNSEQIKKEKNTHLKIVIIIQLLG